MSDYLSFLARKALVVPPDGIATPPALSSKLKEHQRLLTSWALRRGRAAIFADTGLGKGWMILEWARAVAQHTDAPTLILAPLAVSQQFAREAEKLGSGLTICSTQDDVRAGINVTNYQKLHKFDPARFGGVALDESSILKSLDGATRMALIDAFRSTPFRLSATATPSPNDHTELGGQAEFLGVMRHSEMLATFFINGGATTQDWRLKGHAREAFWKWVCSWGAIVKLPSDIGCPDAGYLLPPLEYHEHVVKSASPVPQGLLFALPAETLGEQRDARRESLVDRVAAAAAIANATRGQCIVWCDLNAESEALALAIEGAAELTGSQSDEQKEQTIEDFVAGRARVLVSKPTLCGWGLNLQFARTQIFCGVSHSFEALYQAIRRSWRFGVDGSVHAHIITSEREGAVVANLKRKMRDAEALTDGTRAFVAEFVRTAVGAQAREAIEYSPTVRAACPSWLTAERNR